MIPLIPSESTSVDAWAGESSLPTPEARPEKKLIQLQGGAQFRVFAQADFGFAEGPVFVAHQAKHGQQSRLPEHALAEFRALCGQYRLGIPRPSRGLIV
jgi:hypothetical protein